MYPTETIQHALDTCKAGLVELQTLKHMDPVAFAILHNHLMQLIAPLLLSTLFDWQRMDGTQYQELHVAANQLHVILAR